LPNLTRYLRARAQVIFFRRATLMCFHTRRGAAVEVVAPQHAPGQKKPVESVKEFIEQVVKELVEVERHLEEGWKKLAEMAEKQGDRATVTYAEKHLANKANKVVPQAIHIYNTFHEVECAFTYDATAMKEEAEEQEKLAERFMKNSNGSTRQLSHAGGVEAKRVTKLLLSRTI
uniref:14_3_3 domain-containing protein n=1 Tax=Schistocephalus solidus TaxID=70667 RepID=A0A183TD77_SCHSO